MDAWRGGLLQERSELTSRLGAIATRRELLSHELLSLQRERPELETRVAALRSQTSKTAVAAMKKALIDESSARKSAAKNHFLVGSVGALIEDFHKRGERGRTRSVSVGEEEEDFVLVEQQRSSQERGKRSGARQKKKKQKKKSSSARPSPSHRHRRRR
jgi:hypothetical protein